MVSLSEEAARNGIGSDNDGCRERRTRKELGSVSVVRAAQRCFTARDATTDKAYRVWEPLRIASELVYKIGQQDEMASLHGRCSGLYFIPTQSKIRGRSTEARNVCARRSKDSSRFSLQFAKWLAGARCRKLRAAAMKA